VIATVRGLTFGQLQPLVLMFTIAGAAYFLAVSTIDKVARMSGAQSAFELGVLFAFFPLVGLTYAVYPISDIAAIALFLLAVLEMQRGQWGRFTLWTALALLFHKVMWFFVPPLLLIAFVQHREARRVVPYAVVPLLLWIIGGAIQFGSLLWFIRFNYETHTVMKQGLPVLGGLVETLQGGSAAKLGKGVVVITTLVAALATAVLCALRKLWVGLSVALVVAFLVAAVNAYEIWIAVRYGKLLVVAWCQLAGTTRSVRRAPVAGWVGVAVLLLASNLAFGYYLAHYFHETTPHH
jgi:hypothetical protein